VRIESVTALAFGALNGVALDFSPQLTVVFGPNEAGKSTWHAAIYASLCGMRRAQGLTKHDRKFARLRRPWKSDAWEVRAMVRLDSGRRVELRQDLSDLARCSAVDADFGRDVAGEILNEGTPDAARWLGLDRRSFLAVACVHQAQIQSVVEDAESLQGELQRAAASAARESTAAEAIARLEDFQREQVGQDARHSTKPLRRAKVRAEEAGMALASAREKHTEWLSLEARARQLAVKADGFASELRVLRAVRARKEADLWKVRLDRARSLASVYPNGPPTLAPADVASADEVASALSLWSSRPEVRPLTGPSAAEIRAEIETLPHFPAGDRTPRPEVLAAMKAFERAAQALQLHRMQQPPSAPVPDGKGLAPDQLRELARDLETVAPPVDSGLEAAHREAQHRLIEIRGIRLRRRLIRGVALAALLGGAALWAAVGYWIGGAVAAAGVIALVWLSVRRGETNREPALRVSLEIEAKIGAQRKALVDARSRVYAARAQIADAGLPLNPVELRRLADELVLADRDRQLQGDWSRNREKLQSELAETSQELARGLQNAGAAGAADLAAAFQTYEQACRLRAQQAERAAARESLENQLSDREAAEKAVADAQAQCSNAERRIMAALAACGLDAPDAEAAGDALRHWQEERKERLARFDRAAREYAELNALLDGGTLEELEARAFQHQREAEELAAASGPIPGIAVETDLDQEIRTAEKLASDAGLAAKSAGDRALDRAQFVPGISEAEEALASAQQELERVTRLNRTLTLTLEFLKRAEERAHRDIAPHLAAGLRRWLPGVTQSRYREARVDPRDLSVQVLGTDDEWRDASLLSHGTAEQIYLLLRVVLAERLATTGETCPLILDDVLVQSDLARKHALLDAIVPISRERQVILFTQEEEVLRWAQANALAPDRVVLLPVPS